MCKSSESETVIGEIVNNNNLNNSNTSENDRNYVECFMVIILSVILCKICDVIGGFVMRKINNYIENRARIHMSTENLDNIRSLPNTRN